jgi:hypothetical protein
MKNVVLWDVKQYEFLVIVNVDGGDTFLRNFGPCKSNIPEDGILQM